jgi:hypothetical protein
VPNAGLRHQGYKNKQNQDRVPERFLALDGKKYKTVIEAVPPKKLS